MHSMVTHCNIGNIVDKTTVEPGAKLQRLFEYCRGKAASIIQTCAMMYPLEGYARARKLLHDRFGNPHRIAEAWVTRVTAGPQVKTNDGDSLQCFAAGDEHASRERFTLPNAEDVGKIAFSHHW